MNKITISAGNVSLEAELNDSESAQALWGALPIEGSANRWGEEIYFEIPVSMAVAPDARAGVEVGELGYWPTGSAFCIFFGRTPASTDDKPRAASPVNILGKVAGDATRFSAVQSGEPVTIAAL